MILLILLNLKVQKDFEDCFDVKGNHFSVIFSEKRKTWIIYETLKVWQFIRIYEIRFKKFCQTKQSVNYDEVAVTC